MDTILKLLFGLFAAVALPFGLYLTSKKKTEKIGIYIIVIWAVIGLIYGLVTLKEANYSEDPYEGAYCWRDHYGAVWCD